MSSRESTSVGRRSSAASASASCPPTGSSPRLRRRLRSPDRRA
jgi:hypothetical protein